jgi:segregation and condensation protein A
MHDTLQLVLDKDDVSWKTLLYNLVKTEQMNPWDVDVSILSKKYIETIKEMQQTDFRISGKVLLAAAILLKIKTQHLVDHGVDELDRLLARTQEPEYEDNFFSEFSHDLFDVAEKIEYDEPHLIPRTPQPRHRKITIYDLADALQKALEVKKRKLDRKHPEIKVHIPKSKFDITHVIRNVYSKIKTHFHHEKKAKKLTFSQLLPEDATKEEKAFTFIPLLHLDNQRKIDMLQQEHFGEIGINLLKTKKKVDKELGT